LREFRCTSTNEIISLISFAPFEELDIAFIGMGFNIATLPVADWRDNEDVLERPVPNKFFHSIRGGRAGEVQ
jgi:hypothetical protein